ncbi:MAG: CvpA family protein [Candidatus Omnitrophica bacterium]|nr:CvpA family protein [Candidatus Omnitrophota bacterium]
MDILTRINWVDILIVIIMARISYIALQDGLSHEIFPLIGTVMTAAISMRYYHDLALFIQGIAGIPTQILEVLAFIVLVIGIGLIFKLARFLVDALLKVTWHPFVEKFGGLIFGFLRASVTVSILLTAMSLMPLSYLQYSIKDKSLLGPYFMKIAPEISNKTMWAFPVITK